NRPLKPRASRRCSHPHRCFLLTSGADVQFRCFFAAVVLVAGGLSAHAAVPLNPANATHDSETGVAWYDVRLLGVEGQGWAETEAPYDRLPKKAKDIVRPEVWNLSRHSAGLCARFVTDATTLHARWTLISERLEMVHMPATGVSGLDLYV